MNTIHWLAVFITFVGFMKFAVSVAYGWFAAKGYYGWVTKAGIDYNGGQFAVWDWKWLGIGIAAMIVWSTI